MAAMIHLLEVGPELEIKSLKKLSRRYAMTGGYELALKQDLTAQEAATLYQIHVEALGEYSPHLSTYFTNNSYRILCLLAESNLLSDTVTTELNLVLRRDSLTTQDRV